MKKLLFAWLLFGWLCFSYSFVSAQDDLNAKGAVVANLNIGTNFTGLTVKVLQFALDTLLPTKIPISHDGTGPFIAQCDYMVGKGVSIGGEFTYTKNTFAVTFDDEDFNTQQKWQQTIVAGISARRLAFRAGYHPIRSESWDVYVAASAGIRHQKISLETDVPLLGKYYQTVSVNITDLFSNGISPYFRGELGFRYISPIGLGINAQIGVLRPLFSAGLSYRFK